MAISPSMPSGAVSKVVVAAPRPTGEATAAEGPRKTVSSPRPSAPLDAPPSPSVDRVDLSLPSDPRQALQHLESLRRQALDPAHPDPLAAADLARAIARAQEELRRAEEEARREAARQEEARQKAQHGQSAGALPVPAEALRSLQPAARIQRAAVEGAYAAGDLGPGGLGISLTA